MTYSEARATLRKLNDEIHALNMKAPRFDAPVEMIEAHRGHLRTLNELGKGLGFIRIFDGSFKLDLKKFEGQF